MAFPGKGGPRGGRARGSLPAGSGGFLGGSRSSLPVAAPRALLAALASDSLVTARRQESQNAEEGGFSFQVPHHSPHCRAPKAGVVIGPPVCRRALNLPAPHSLSAEEGLGGQGGLDPQQPRASPRGTLAVIRRVSVVMTRKGDSFTHWWVLGSTFQPTSRWGVGMISTCGLALDRGRFSDLHVGKLPWAMLSDPKGLAWRARRSAGGVAPLLQGLRSVPPSVGQTPLEASGWTPDRDSAPEVCTGRGI